MSHQKKGEKAMKSLNHLLKENCLQVGLTQPLCALSEMLVSTGTVARSLLCLPRPRLKFQDTGCSAALL